MKFFQPRRWPAARIAGIVALSAVCTLSACDTGGDDSDGADAVPTGGTAQAGGTAVVANKPNINPSYIFPFTSREQTNVTNVNLFQRALFRPLYWYGKGSEPTVDERKSLALLPRFTDGNRTVTIELKPWKFADGSPIDAQSVRFWINMLTARKLDFGQYSPGGLPDILEDAEYEGNTVTLHLKEPVNSERFLLQDLATVTPLPLAWDLTGPGKRGRCATDVKGCGAVYEYLDGEAKKADTYATNPLWKIVSGPWVLTSFSTDGNYELEPNPKYDGEDKPKLDKVKYVPFASDVAEYNVLRGGGELDVGYVPLQSAPQAGAGISVPRSNALNGYYLAPQLNWGYTFIALNYRNPKVSPILNQVYFRQAIQSVVDQPSYIRTALRGYGVPTTGPVPVRPENKFFSKEAQSATPSFDIEAAKRLLTEHGWNVEEGRPAECVTAGDRPDACGAGIEAGTKLELTLDYPTGDKAVEQEMQALQSDAGRAGIVLKLRGAPRPTVLGKLTGCTDEGGACGWQIGSIGGGYNLSYPNGEEYSSSSPVNIGGYKDPTMDRLVDAAARKDDPEALAAVQRYAAEQLPLIYMPTPVLQILAVNEDLRGVVPPNVQQNASPEDWFFVADE